MRSLALLLLLAAAPLAAQDFRVADSIVESGISRGIYPGAVLIVGRRDRALHRRGYGHLTWSGSSPVPSPDSTLWDLASLTKVVGTAPAVLRLLAERHLELDAPVSRYLSGYTGRGRERITLRMLLTHTSGLRAYIPFFQLTQSRDSGIAMLYREPPRHPPGTVEEYSDLNFLLLGLVLETVEHRPLDQVVHDLVLVPAGLTGATYHPRRNSPLTAPTGQYRGHPVCCQVNDQNANLWGGAAGHAGLFATGRDLERYARLWLGLGSIDGSAVLDSGWVRRFLAPDGGGTRLLGWERPDSTDRDDSAYGHLLSPEAYGHTGWTGTLLWIDPTRDLYLVLLTNRSYAPKLDRSIRALRGVRGALADAVVRAISR